MFDLFLDLRLYCDDLFEALLRQHPQVTVLFGLHRRRSQAIINDGNLSEEVATSQQFFRLLSLLLVILLLADINGVIFKFGLSADYDTALARLDQVDGHALLILLNDHGVRLAQLSFHSLNNRLDQLFFSNSELFLTHGSSSKCELLFCCFLYRFLQLKILFDSSREYFDRDFLVQ